MLVVGCRENGFLSSEATRLWAPAIHKNEQSERKLTRPSSESKYLHGSAPEEQQRLALLNNILNEACLRELNLKGGERILDLGSGLGQFTRAMARAAGSNGKLLGVERDPGQLLEARRLAQAAQEEELVEFRQGDALALPLRQDEWDSFDLAHARFLLEHLPDPLAAVRALVRAVRPGGRVVLIDDDHSLFRLWPHLPEFELLWAAYLRSFEHLGNDPYVGRRLVALLHQAGATPTRNTLIPYVSCAGNPNFAAYVENLVKVIMGAREVVLEAGMAAALCDESMAALTAWSRNPEAAIWYGLCWAEAVRPA